MRPKELPMSYFILMKDFVETNRDPKRFADISQIEVLRVCIFWFCERQLHFVQWRPMVGVKFFQIGIPSPSELQPFCFEIRM